MDCDNARELLPLAEVEALGWWKRQQVRRHLADCPDCRRELEVLRATAALLAKAPRAKAPVEIWRGIEGALAQAPVRKSARGFLTPRRIAGGLVGLGLAAATVAVLVFQRSPAREPHVFDHAAPFVRYHSILSQNDPLSDQVGLDLRSVVLVTNEGTPSQKP
ncbi:MAG: hypothetical protein COZ06_10490 [Armatimonadetes bacterium CG_4_10_14_3_um_filter_66_18]|nr:hypothetical protein [Armatimonadota bacterium]OIP09936.1 MAG: hypothetical protein AUJ96_04450 [Armatimonadetes bacterium CG2_30_66_41]PIU88706.1 MAG: hypothetical protein COS65_30165 [Armatimonadetes bacterium CG06_land_8_20_14_3_00_66_21]PIW16100.1 MAG: hypothetical protein COW34_06185 [Armatimonadetes bacterium CG17_big_fil_post_rev_8_21_14_2_50_66_6]PIX49332.1 MAG: hypothetical protein COZ57_03690 [Armatimonadetes bacterium CG_4_8_14_3_um_filter_66_20]PIY50224.1 MAG: hypothetical prote